MAERKSHVSKEKKDVVAEFVKLINENKVIAAVDVENLPALQLNKMRSNLRGKAHLLMAKRRLLVKAFEESKKPETIKLKPHLSGMPALLFSNENPFKLYKILKKSKSPAPIKAGQKAPKDIIVPAGQTGFAPGPIIGELGSIGVKSGIEGGKVAIKADAVVAKEGQVVNQKLAGLLQRLQIYPMEIGLNLVAAYEDGMILGKKDLDVDEDEFMEKLKTAAKDAFALTIARAIPMKENIETLIQTAHFSALSLSKSDKVKDLYS